MMRKSNRLRQGLIADEWQDGSEFKLQLAPGTSNLKVEL
jgi:hypothetical protein